jgi:hypothetical protein
MLFFSSVKIYFGSVGSEHASAGILTYCLCTSMFISNFGPIFFISLASEHPTLAD